MWSGSALTDLLSESRQNSVWPNVRINGFAVGSDVSLGSKRRSGAKKGKRPLLGGLGLGGKGRESKAWRALF